MKIPAQEATCKETGNHKYHSYKICQEVFLDSEASIKTTIQKETIPVLTSHPYEVTAPATCQSKGEMRSYITCRETQYHEFTLY